MSGSFVCFAYCMSLLWVFCVNWLHALFPGLLVYLDICDLSTLFNFMFTISVQYRFPINPNSSFTNFFLKTPEEQSKYAKRCSCRWGCDVTLMTSKLWQRLISSLYVCRLFLFLDYHVFFSLVYYYHQSSIIIIIIYKFTSFSPACLYPNRCYFQISKLECLFNICSHTFMLLPLSFSFHCSLLVIRNL